MTPEQLLLVAREFCAQHKVTVTNFGALVAAASLSTAKMEESQSMETGSRPPGPCATCSWPTRFKRAQRRLCHCLRARLHGNRRQAFFTLTYYCPASLKRATSETLQLQ